ncbi:WD repeat [Mactra antiquata]
MEQSTIVASLEHTICSHTSDVNGVCFSKGKYLATCSGDKTVRVWNTEDYTEVQSSPLCGHTYYVHCCAFSPFGTLLASCSTDGKVIIWDPLTGKKKYTFQHESKSPIRVIRFSPDSKMLLSGCDDNNLCLWNLTTESLVTTFKGHEATVFGCDFSPDGQYIVSGSSDGDLQVWDAKYGHGVAILLLLEGHDLGVTCCEFSPTYGMNVSDGPPTGTSRFLLATSGQDDLVKLWDFVSVNSTTSVLLKEKYILKGHTGSVMQCRFSLNGKLLASGSIDKTVRLWDPMSGACLHVIEAHKRYVTCCAFSSDGRYLASGSNDKTVMLWKLQSEQQLFTALENQDELYIGSAVNQGEDNVGSSVGIKPEQWKVEDVCKWIKEIGLEQYEDNFQQHHIDGVELLNLNADSLKSGLQIDSLGHRNKILRSRARLMEHPIVQQKENDCGIPDEYLCPITREIMKDPVICTDGYTYERAAILSWMEKGKDRSPMTNAILSTKDLTPNRCLKMLIQRYLNP